MRWRERTLKSRDMGCRVLSTTGWVTMTSQNLRFFLCKMGIIIVPVCFTCLTQSSEWPNRRPSVFTPTHPTPTFPGDCHIARQLHSWSSREGTVGTWIWSLMHGIIEATAWEEMVAKKRGKNKNRSLREYWAWDIKESGGRGLAGERRNGKGQEKSVWIPWTERIPEVRVIYLNEPTDRWEDAESGKKPPYLEGAAGSLRKVLGMGAMEAI